MSEVRCSQMGARGPCNRRGIRVGGSTAFEIYRCPKRHTFQVPREPSTGVEKPAIVDESPYGGDPPYQRSSDTSEKAALEMAPLTGKQKRRVLSAISAHPDCDENLGTRLRLKHHTICARRRELVLLELVKDSGERMVSPTSGKTVTVWEAVG